MNYSNQRAEALGLLGTYLLIPKNQAQGPHDVEKDNFQPGDNGTNKEGGIILTKTSKPPNHSCLDNTSVE